ncbi:unnamed protein product [Orchesella dallaii]|uniref:Uncharacterized protein n=1 Tax=Orchesella dallaii TaxID=48710 RepID=A0ABP1RPY4_9HEXA
MFSAGKYVAICFCRDPPYVSLVSLILDRFGQYEQKLKLGWAHCEVIQNPYHPFRSESVNPFLPVYDCRKQEFRPGQSYFEDECGNPILYKKDTHWNRLGFARVHIVYLNIGRVVCCINYGDSKLTQFLHQTSVCNTPSKEIRLETWCRNPEDSLRNSIIGTYMKKWNEVKNEGKLWLQLSTDFFIVRCMCGGVLDYVKKIYPVEESWVNELNCENRIKTIV